MVAIVGFGTLVILGFSLSVDAFAGAMGKGASGPHRSFLDALRIGLVFGLVEAATPIAGWALGRALSDRIAAIDHWIAFGLLGAVGGHMLWAAWRDADAPDDESPARQDSLPALILIAIATSLDAAAVGVTLALIDVDIVVASLVIGAVSTAMATTGVLIGRHAGRYLGRYAEAAGGVVLIAIGVVILIEHLGQG